MDPLKVALTLLELAVRLIGLENAKAALSEMDVRLANAGADAVEVAKWGRTSEPKR